MPATRWWKCDLQVATPAWEFTLPAGSSYDFNKAEDRQRFADLYMTALTQRNIEVIAVADHNSADWVDDMVAAGKKHNVIVFPGCEITSGTGADGVHLVVIGDCDKTRSDFDLLLSGHCGFNHDNPRFLKQGERDIPAAAPKSVAQILDDLPPGYLVMAPHALNDNGIASGNTVKGDLRWKTLHHPRLSAVDPGDCTDTGDNSFNNSFRQRKLRDFPCLKGLAFVSTSDAYRIDRLGSRFSWIRMGKPSVEALRQAFLDREARIICDWDSRLKDYTGGNPNAVRHAWIGNITLAGKLGNSSNPVHVPFHPCLNVIIGGRGSGKSTIVAAIRQLYVGTAGLPEKVKQDADAFAETVLGGASLAATHYLPTSQEAQTAQWTTATGRMTIHSDRNPVPTSYAVRVVNQKELFERVSRDNDDPLAASRSFLSFVDDGLGLQRTMSPSPGSWWRTHDDACEAWRKAVSGLQKAKADILQSPSVVAKISELELQVSAFDAPEAKDRRKRNATRQNERDALAGRVREYTQWLASIKDLADSQVFAPVEQPSELESSPESSDGSIGAATTGTAPTVLETQTDLSLPELSTLESGLRDMAAAAKAAVTRAVTDAETALSTWEVSRNESAWWKAVADAEADSMAYLDELRAKGISPESYQQLTSELASQRALLKRLRIAEELSERAEESVRVEWAKIVEGLSERRRRRTELLLAVSERSGQLKFEVAAHEDYMGWVTAVRLLLNLRADGYIDDVVGTSKWLWCEGAPHERTARQSMWREALVSNDFSALQRFSPLKANWVRKLQSLDPALRLRLATEIADDRVDMLFLKDGGAHERPEDWQIITEGSPGQRTAAMLGFVLHHGTEPLVLDQPEDDLDTELISTLVVRELRSSRCKRQVIVVTHNANIPVNGDAENVIVLENRDGSIRLRTHGETAETTETSCGPIEKACVRRDIQKIMEGGILAFMQREDRYNNEVRGAVVV